MNNKILSILFDLIQICSLLFLVLTGPLISSKIHVISAQIVALIIIVSAGWEMRRNRFYRVPDVGKQDRLVTSGVYRYIRHPMYTSQLLFTGTLLINYFSFLRLTVFVLLLVNFLFKIQYEENLLMKHFADYPVYRKRSFKLVPFLF